MSDRDERPSYLLDVNVLLVLVSPDHVHHAAARRWLGDVAGHARWATTPVTEPGLVRLLLNPVVVGSRLMTASVLDLLPALRAHATHEFLVDDASLCESTVDLRTLVGHRQVTDLHLVDLARRRGAVLATFDRALVGCLAPEDRGLVALVPA